MQKTSRLSLRAGVKACTSFGLYGKIFKSFLRILQVVVLEGSVADAQSGKYGQFDQLSWQAKTYSLSSLGGTLASHSELAGILANLGQFSKAHGQFFATLVEVHNLFK